jgi:4-aminobutyrate aminotransferase-like enzyme
MDFSSPEATKRFVQYCFAAGVILGWTLHRDTVVRLAPPLVISPTEIDHAVSVIREALQKT